MFDELVADEFEHAGLTVKIVGDSEPSFALDFDRFGEILIDHRDRPEFGNAKLPAYFDDYYSSIADYAERSLGEGYLVVGLRYADYGSSGARLYETDLDDANGIAYVSVEDIREEYGVQRISAKTRDKARSVLLGEVETIDHVLQGNVYGFVVEDEAGEHMASCFGFVGEHDDEHLIGEAKDAAEFAAKERDKARGEARERAIRMGIAGYRGVPA